MGVFDPGQYGRTARMLLLYLVYLSLATTLSPFASEAHAELTVPGLEASYDAFESSAINLNLQDAMRTLRRMKRMTTKQPEDILTLDRETVTEAQKKQNESDSQDTIYCLRLGKLFYWAIKGGGAFFRFSQSSPSGLRY
ncbi:unnamed protein product [Bursaphelenchus okinawaensis]|uniref:Uncharacterized protein n=1 Tax=Bursaphelenchus okinawaensis TaxID=465554 RepID=A0A811KJI3_9BILA|nr:unnamed protein product [Bursaphelenchus okinawaensis]CAG9104566.1 unnamed protein product [Bursaphelenchus okinawaensis]